MSIVSDLFSSGVGTVIESVGKSIDSIVTSDKERLELKNKLVQIETDAQNRKEELNIQYEQQFTDRHKNDMQSDSWLSKNIRPLGLAYILVMYSLLSILSGFDFKVTESYVQLLGQWGMLIMGFYYSSRGLEKIAQIVKRSKE